MTQSLWTCSCNHCLRWRKVLLLMVSASLANAKGDDAALGELAADPDPDLEEIRAGLEGLSDDIAILGRAAETAFRGVLNRQEQKGTT